MIQLYFRNCGTSQCLLWPQLNSPRHDNFALWAGRVVQWYLIYTLRWLWRVRLMNPWLVKCSLYCQQVVFRYYGRVGTQLWFLLVLLSGIAHSWRTAMGKYRCLGRAGWDGGKGELPFAVRSGAACSFTWRWVSQLRAYGSGVVMRISSDNSSLMFLLIGCLDHSYYFLGGKHSRE